MLAPQQSVPTLPVQAVLPTHAACTWDSTLTVESAPLRQAP